MAKLIDDKASEWRMTLKHVCGSTFEIDRDDIVYTYLEGVETSSSTYHVTCPACGLQQNIPYGDLPGWVQSYAMKAKKRTKKETRA